MSKWALWAAHRYVRPGAAVPRHVGPDGRDLARPWRIVSPEARRAVRQLRAARPQAPWTRLIGLACLAVAGVFALDPIGPIPTHVAASPSARPGPRLQSTRGEAPVLLAPGGTLDAVPVVFRWRADVASAPFTLVLLGEAYDEVLRREGLVGSEWTADDAARALFATGGTFHWAVLGQRGGEVVASALESFDFARPGTSGATVR
jgi:hypothetical protein